MLSNLWNNITEWFNDFNERGRLIKQFNQSAREAFISGGVPTLLKAKISSGNGEYKHQFSHWLHSGFRVQAFTGETIGRSQTVQIGEAIMSDVALVRKLVVLGFDTLEVYGDGSKYGCQWQLKDHVLISYRDER